MTQRVVLFNGPPSSGKDTAARYLYHSTTIDYPFVQERMSMPIKKAFASIMGEYIDKWGDVAGYEDKKEQNIELLGCSYRQWQIDFSEKFMKPLYGEAIFGALFCLRAARHSKNAVFLVPDCGFDIEYKTLTDVFGLSNVFVIKLYRPGCTYAKDSRSWLKVGSDFIPDQGDATGRYVAHINNSGTQDEFEIKILNTVFGWLK